MNTEKTAGPESLDLRVHKNICLAMGTAVVNLGLAATEVRKSRQSLKRAREQFKELEDVGLSGVGYLAGDKTSDTNVIDQHLKDAEGLFVSVCSIADSIFNTLRGESDQEKV